MAIEDHLQGCFREKCIVAMSEHSRRDVMKTEGQNQRRWGGVISEVHTCLEAQRSLRQEYIPELTRDTWPSWVSANYPGPGAVVPPIRGKWEKAMPPFPSSPDRGLPKGTSKSNTLAVGIPGRPWRGLSNGLETLTQPKMILSPSARKIPRDVRVDREKASTKKSKQACPGKMSPQLTAQVRDWHKQLLTFP